SRIEGSNPSDSAISRKFAILPRILPACAGTPGGGDAFPFATGDGARPRHARSAQHASVDAELRAGDEAGFPARQEQHHIGDVLTLGVSAERNRLRYILLRNAG